MKNQELEILKEQNTEAIESGNEFPGYFGCPVEDLSKEELIMVLNIIHHELRKTKTKYQESSFLSIPPSR